MKTAGIIAEYNPFHNGHKFHIEETRKKTGADYIIAAISGDFVQRGAPAFLNKYDRAQMALENGVDLVLELPVTTALSSAEGFATGGVCLLENLGVVDVLSFGCEDASSELAFRQTADILAKEPESYKKILSHLLKTGVSFPKARKQAVLSCLNLSHENEAVSSLLSRPNNILGLEYQKAICKYDCCMDTLQIPRIGNGYNSTELSSGFASATAIRKFLFENKDLPQETLPKISGQVPESVHSSLIKASQENSFLQENDFSDMLFYALLSQKNRFPDFGSKNCDLAYRTSKLLEKYENWTQFALLLKTKNQTYSAISRWLSHVLLGITREDIRLASHYQYAPYARVLGFRKKAAPLLKAVKSHHKIPVLMQLADDSALLNEECRHLLNLDLFASSLYNRMLYSKAGTGIKSDFRHPLIIL